MPPSSMESRSAPRGAARSSTRERPWRGSRSMRMGMGAVRRGPGHDEADLLARGRSRNQRFGQATAMDDGDAVADLEEFVEVLADDDDRRALARQVDQRLPDGGGGCRI